MTATVPAPVAGTDLETLAARAAAVVADHLGVPVPPYTVVTGSASAAATAVTGRLNTPAAVWLWLRVWAGGLRAHASTVMTPRHAVPVIVMHRRARGWTYRVLVHELVHAAQWDRPGALDTDRPDTTPADEVEAYRIEAELTDDVCPGCGDPEPTARLDLSTARKDVSDCRACGAIWEEVIR